MPARKAKEEPRQSPYELRVAPNGWDGFTLAYRRSKAAALRAFRSHYKVTMPESWRLMQCIVRTTITRAWADCTSLDELLQERGEPQVFRESSAIFDDPMALEALHRIGCIEFNKPLRSKSPMYALMRKGDTEARRKKEMHDLRELLRDQWPPEQALQIMGPTTDPLTVIEFGKILAEFHQRPERFQRSTSDWLVRGWIPLRLYECPADGENACERVRFVARMLEISTTEGEILTAWRNVRSRVFGNANPLFSQSAGAA